MSLMSPVLYPEEGRGYAFQYFGASLVAQMVKNLPLMPETLVQFLGWEDPLDGMSNDVA